MPETAFLKGMLVSRLRESSEDKDGSGITRRSLLVGSTALGIGGVGLHVAEATPRVRRAGRALILNYGSQHWRLDPNLYPPDARVLHRSSNNGIWLALKKATLPGTSLDISMVARVFKHDQAWQIQLRVPALGMAGEFLLAEWLGGEAKLESPFNGSIALGPGNTVKASAATAILNSSLSVDIEAGFRKLQLVGSGRGYARKLTLNASGPMPSALRAAGGLHGRPATNITLSQVVWDRPVRLSCGNRESRGMFVCAGPSELRGEVTNTPRGVPAVFLLFDGPGRLAVSRVRSPALHLGRASALSSRIGRRRQLHLAGELSPEFHADLSIGVAQVAPDDDHPVYAEFQTSQPADFRARAKLVALHLPMAGGANALLDVPASPVEILSSERTPFEEAEAAADSDDPEEEYPGNKLNKIVVGPHPFLFVELDGSRLRLSRGADLFDLVFEFTGYSLRVDQDGEAYLRRRRPPDLSADWPEAGLTVHFPPQHIGETVTDMQGLGCNKPVPCPPVEAHQYGPSRMVFDLGQGKGKDVRWKDRPFNIEALTDWENLPLIVQHRAKEVLGVDVEQQLKVPDIGVDTTLATAFTAIAKTILPPGANETALELSGRLIFSPSEAGRWLTPRAEPAATSLIWNARLNDVGRRTVRAIWSSWMTPGQFGHCFMTAGAETDPTKDAVAWDQKVLALRPKHHWDIVGQTSIYGLPALRRIVDKTETDTKQEDFKKIPRATVVRPDAPYTYLKQIDDCQYKGDPESGVAIAAPFDDADITLTAQGGIFLADWYGDPPKLLPFAGGEWDRTLRDKLLMCGTNPRPPRLSTFALERLSIETWLGRDVRVEAFEKGYLLPLGIRASFVELCERRYVRHPNKPYPVAYEVRRTFLLIQRPDKQYPGVNHPYSANPMPAKQVKMLTKVTPDLLSPEANTVGEKRLAGRVLMGLDGQKKLSTDALVFWPRITAAFVMEKEEGTGKEVEVPAPTGDVKFKFGCDGDVTPAIGNMLFVSNRAFGSTDDLKLIADHYRDSPENQRKFVHAGAKRRYAQTATEGETEFDTDNWVMTLSGRKLPTEGGGEIESFLMDGRMEGADQPPFYPELVHAEVVVQSLDRILGRSQGLIRVRYPGFYRVNGFGAANPGEIFLEVVEPSIPIAFGGQSNAVGGLAKPDAYLAALSRKTGLVGGKAPGKPRSMVRSLLDPSDRNAGFARSALQSPAERSFAPPAATQSSYEAAQSGSFDPTEFFGDDATLLGVIKLREVVEAALASLGDAPRLVETLAFGALSDEPADRALERIRSAAQAMWPSVRDALNKVDRAIEGVVITPPPNSNLPAATFPDLYPDLHRAYQTARRGLGGTELPEEIDLGTGSLLLEIANAQSLGDVVTAATQLVAALRPLPGAIERVARDPIPPLIQGVLDSLAGTWKLITQLIEGKPAALVGLLTKQLHESLHQFCTQLGDLGSILFGLDGQATCDDLLANPNDAAPRLAASLFASELAEPVVRVIIKIRNFESVISGRIAFARASLRDEVQATVKSAADKLAAKLSKTAEILRGEVQSQLAHDLVSDIETQINGALTGGANPFDVLDRTARVIEGLPPLIERHVDSWRQKVKAKVAEETEAIFADFREQTFEPIKKAVKEKLDAEVERVRLLIKQQKTEAEEVAQELVFLADQLFDALISTTDFARITEAGAKLTSWCNASAAKNVAKAANALTNKLAGPQADIEAAIMAIGATLTGPPFPTTVPAIEARRRRMLELTQALGGMVLELAKVRTELDNLATPPGDLCTSPAKFLKPASRLLDIRLACCDRVSEIVDEAELLVAEMTDQVDLKNVPAQLAKAAGDLLLRLTSVEIVKAATQEWVKAKAQVDALTQEFALPNSQYPAVVQEAVRLLKEKADALHPVVIAANTPAELNAVVKDVVAYARGLEKALIAKVLQSVAMPSATAGQLVNGVDRFFQSIGGTFLDLESHALKLVTEIIQKAEAPPLDLLLNPVIVGKLKSAGKKLEEETELLGNLTKDGLSVEARINAARALRDYWRDNRPPAMVDVVKEVIGTVRELLDGNLGVIFNASLRPALQELEKQARQALSQFVPTGLTAKYEFSAPLKPVTPLFKMSGAVRKSNLVLSSILNANFLTGERSLNVVGTIEPFELQLVGSLDMATLYFDTTTFKSVNGSSPRFDINVKDVKLGALLEFLQPLQAWLSPSGNGFFIRPILKDGGGIEAGYTYDAGVVELGAIKFLAVNFAVLCRLFFSGKDAQFEVSLATPERPFLCVAAPCYAGGGYIRLIANAKRITTAEISFSMGAAQAIAFGPLKAHGRVVAGFTLIQNGDARELVAFVEAVGEGNIACFSMCVALRVEMRRVDAGGNSRMYGWARYTFTFKVGRFLEYHYSVTAKYGVDGGKKNSTGQLDRLARFADPKTCLEAIFEPSCKQIPGGARYINRVPLRASQWRDYNRHLSMNLL